MIDLQYLANLGEVVGAVVVVLSLIYLAVQVRQNTRAQRTENYSRALDRLAAMQSMLSQDGEMSLIFSKAVLNTSNLTPEERIRFTWSMYEAFGAFEFMFTPRETLQYRPKSGPAGRRRWHGGCAFLAFRHGGKKGRSPLRRVLRRSWNLCSKTTQRISNQSSDSRSLLLKENPKSRVPASDPIMRITDRV